jgi:hypothetical protein
VNRLANKQMDDDMPTCLLQKESTHLSIFIKLNIAVTIAKTGSPFELMTLAAKRVWWTEETYVLRRDLMVPLTSRPEARTPVLTRRLAPEDNPQIVAERPSGLLLGVLRAGAPPVLRRHLRKTMRCYLQWLFLPNIGSTS